MFRSIPGQSPANIPAFVLALLLPSFLVWVEAFTGKITWHCLQSPEVSCNFLKLLVILVILVNTQNHLQLRTYPVSAGHLDDGYDVLVLF